MKPFFAIWEDSTESERVKLRDNILKYVGVSYSTFYQWLRLGRVPKPSQRLISQLLNQDIEILFPNTEQEA